MPSPSIYVVNPSEGLLGFHAMEVLKAWGIGNLTNFADLSTTTVAALVPKDWNVALCDERLDPVDLDHPADVVALTGKVSQRERIIALAKEFRARGKLVMIGGPSASLAPQEYEPHADILVTGEMEDIAADVFADVAAGRHRGRYEGGRPDLSASPIPRWDLYPTRRALEGQVQTSRGCPFECEFCDVIQYLGRKQRWKEPDQVVRELDTLYVSGFRQIFLADDNFTVMRRRARELLERLALWNASRLAGRATFATQLSIDVARDPDLVALCVKANLRVAFIGIETPNEASLAETMKRQNLRVDLAEEIRKLTRAGLMVIAGIVVGFDNDGPDIFERQAAFINSLPVPLLNYGLLVAPSATPLYARMEKEGRLTGHGHLGGANFVETNIAPKLMSEAHLRRGSGWLLNHIYAPRAFAQRLKAYADLAPRPPRAPPVPKFGAIERALAPKLAALGEEERRLVAFIERLIWQRPDLHANLAYCMMAYCQARHMFDVYGVWDPDLGQRAAPPLAA